MLTQFARSRMQQQRECEAKLEACKGELEVCFRETLFLCRELAARCSQSRADLEHDVQGKVEAAALAKEQVD